MGTTAVCSNCGMATVLADSEFCFTCNEDGMRQKAEEFGVLLQEAKDKAGNWWDCVVPITGTAENVLLIHVLKNIHGLQPLGVVLNHNWFTETGWYNIQNILETFHIDHIQYTPSRDLISRVAKRSLLATGDPCWHWYAGFGSFPAKIAHKYKIPLLIFSDLDSSVLGLDSETGMFDHAEMLKRIAGLLPDELVCDYVEAHDVHLLQPLTAEEMEESGLHAVHVFDYLKKDVELIQSFVADKYYWAREDSQAPNDGVVNPGGIVPGMHDFNAKLENGPDALAYLLEITGMDIEEAISSVKEHKGEELPKPGDAQKARPFARQVIDEVCCNRGEPYLVEDFSYVPVAENARRELPKSFLDISISEILQRYASGEMTPEDVANLVVRNVEAKEDSVKAWEAFDINVLLRDAQKSAERMKQGRIRWLEGIPVAAKDVFNTRDFPTQMGSPLWEGYEPGNDARIVGQMKEKGCVIPGKTVTAEFAVHTLGKTLNPHDPARNPGTSSSGSAAAVATGMVPAALGTQTAASIVRPASFCGVYGMKPSFGLIPRTGILKTTDSLDTVGFFTVFQEDLKRLFETMRVRGENYPFSHKALSDSQRQAAPEGRPWRVALVRTHTWEYAEDYAKQAILDWAERLRAEGMEVLEVELPVSMKRAHEVHATIYDKTLSYYFAEEYSRKELVSPIMNEIIEHGMELPADSYEKALREQEVLGAAMDDFLQNYDAMVSLSTAGHAPLREEREKPDPGLMWNMTWLPVISAPVFKSDVGLPFGVQLVARRYNDYKLLKFCDALKEKGLIPEKANTIKGVK